MSSSPNSKCMTRRSTVKSRGLRPNTSKHHYWVITTLQSIKTTILFCKTPTIQASTIANSPNSNTPDTSIDTHSRPLQITSSTKTIKRMPKCRITRNPFNTLFTTTVNNHPKNLISIVFCMPSIAKIIQINNHIIIQSNNLLLKSKFIGVK
jgi:hypothetical protein